MFRIVATVLMLLLVCGPATPMPPMAKTQDDRTASLPVWTVARPTPDRYLSAHGLRAFAGGYAEDGLELWTFPLQIASGYQLDFAQGDAGFAPALPALASADVDPLGITRRYTVGSARVSERIETRGELPGIRVRFRIAGSEALRIRVRLRPSLNLMWPAGIGGQEFGWDAQARGFVLSEPSGDFRALVASPQAAAHAEPNNDRRGSTFGREIWLALAPTPCGRDRCATLVFAGQSEADEDAHATARALLRAGEAPLPTDVARFDPARVVGITTPDAAANRAIRWAQIALEQAWTCNRRLGCGLVAGYGPSHGARRPQYAWYFGGDGLVSTRALLAEGDHGRARQALEFILRYQHPDNGMIWHELSQSAGFLEWTRDYDYMYVHVDIAFDFLHVLADYHRGTADDAFLERHWPKILQAWRYCLSTLDAGDGLPRVPEDKMSGNEQDRLTDELTLSAAWVEAAEAMSELARARGDQALARQAHDAGVRARESVRARYRDHDARRWISGFMRSGAAGESTSAADMAAISSGAATPEETAETLARLGTPAYLTAWGLRSRPTTAQDYDPEAYSRGSVWGLGSAAAAEALWRAGHGDTANAIWQALVPWSAQDAPGHMHEVMSGSRFHPQRESVPEQTWSSAGFVSATVHGLLGLEVDAVHGQLTFAPQPPSAWRFLRVERVRIGARLVDLHWRREGEGATLDVHNHGASFRLTWKQPGDPAAAPRALSREIPPGSTRLVLH